MRIVPRGVGYTIEIVYRKTLPRPVTRTAHRVGVIDLGTKNIVAFVDNIGGRPIVIKDEGKGIKSINQYYERAVKKLRKKYAKQQQIELKKQNNLKY
ncbi:MAG: RNA-guided endonuclease TnpB family protein, partial [Candidatus Heimdallarchaeaceae archaeon]